MSETKPTKAEVWKTIHANLLAYGLIPLGVRLHPADISVTVQLQDDQFDDVASALALFNMPAGETYTSGGKPFLWFEGETTEFYAWGSYCGRKPSPLLPGWQVEIYCQVRTANFPLPKPEPTPCDCFAPLSEPEPEPLEPRRVQVEILAHTDSEMWGPRLKVSVPSWNTYGPPLLLEDVPAGVWKLPLRTTVTAMMDVKFGEPHFSAWEWETNPADVPVMNGTTCEDITGEQKPAADPLAAASQQLRETTTGDEFAAAFGGFMGELGKAAACEQGDHDDCDPARCADAERAVAELHGETAPAVKA